MFSDQGPICLHSACVSEGTLWWQPWVLMVQRHRNCVYHREALAKWSECSFTDYLTQRSRSDGHPKQSGLCIVISCHPNVGLDCGSMFSETSHSQLCKNDMGALSDLIWSWPSVLAEWTAPLYILQITIVLQKWCTECEMSFLSCSVLYRLSQWTSWLKANSRTTLNLSSGLKSSLTPTMTAKSTTQWRRVRVRTRHHCPVQQHQSWTSLRKSWLQVILLFLCVQHNGWRHESQCPPLSPEPSKMWKNWQTILPIHGSWVSEVRALGRTFSQLPVSSLMNSCHCLTAFSGNLRLFESVSLIYCKVDLHTFLDFCEFEKLIR